VGKGSTKLAASKVKERKGILQIGWANQSAVTRIVIRDCNICIKLEINLQFR
jgi:hypothetical protein